MTRIDLTSPAQLGDMLRRYGFYTKKRFGQNFLVDRNIINKLVDALDLHDDDCVLEIGPGVGTLTQAVAEKCGKVVAVEVDRDLIPILAETMTGFTNVKIVTEDILRLNLTDFLKEEFGGCKVKVVGNLPYYITAPIIGQIFEAKENVERIVLMVQKEVAERLYADPGGRNYGSMSLFVQYHSQPEIIAQVSSSVFFPSPDVSSTVIRLTPYQTPPVDVPDEKLFFDVVHTAFSKRRKTLLNSLSQSAPLFIEKTQAASALERAGIDPVRRAETLSLEEFARLTKEIAGD
ncbi:MAG: 16S rRNA (adenine(1518)-N(6)/adenine(1519)-N(6))-dimethyltransferase RsmA [Armatimonadota bacterium]